MASAVGNLQNAIYDEKTSLTELLRRTKVMAGKLNLEDMAEWVEYELAGYPVNVHPPPYRKVTTMHLEVHHPIYEWRFARTLEIVFPIDKAMSYVENLSLHEFARMPLSELIPLYDSSGRLSTLPQQLVVSGAEFKMIMAFVRDELLKWTIELDKRGIKGNETDFSPDEKQLAHTMVVNYVFHGDNSRVNHGSIDNSLNIIKPA